MPIHTITPEGKARLTDSACQLFKTRNPDFYPCQANSEKLISFVHQQLGQSLDEYPYPVLIDQWQAAYDHIKQTSWFYTRPVEEEIEDPAVTRERLAQQKVRDDYEARQRAEKIQRDNNVPLNQLRNEVGVQNADFRQQRDANLLPTRAVGLESRHVEQVQLGIKAQARVNVGLAHPALSPKSAEFTKLYAAELACLRG
jgi:hypothetical protein